MRTRSLASFALLFLMLFALMPFSPRSVTAQQAAESQPLTSGGGAPMRAQLLNSPVVLSPPASPSDDVAGLPTPASCLIYAVDKHASKDAQVFTADLRTKTAQALGPLAGFDLEGIAVHPLTRVLYATASEHSHPASQLFTLDSVTGQLTAIGVVGFSDLADITFRSSDATLWGWVEHQGLIRIDLASGVGTLVVANREPIEGIAWSVDGATLYAAAGERLWAYTAANGVLKKLASNLPKHTTALTMRPDGLLLGGIDEDDTAGFFAYDPTQRRVVMHVSVPGDFDPDAITWPSACGNASPGGPTTIITGITLDKTQVCAGDTVLVTVAAHHPESLQEHVDITVNGQWGTPQYLQFTGVPGTRLIDVTASTAEKYSDRQQRTIEVVPCATGPTLPVVHTRPNLYHDLVVDFEVANAASMERQTPVYTWDFGDGKTAQTTVPAITHYYGDALDRDSESSVFQTSITVHQDGQPDLVTHKTVTLWNAYALNKARGFIQPRITADPSLQPINDTLVGAYTITNLEDTPIQLTSRQLQYQPCDPNLPDTDSAPEPTAIVVAGKQALAQQLVLPNASVTSDSCGVRVLLMGQADRGVQVYATLYFQIKPNLRTVQDVQDPAVVARLNQIINQKLLGDATTISDEDLYRLEQEAKIPRDIQNQFTLASTANALTPQDVDPVGQPCIPGATPPRPGLSCQISSSWYYRPAYIANAQKGDVILSPGCHGTIGELLRSVDPSQLYSHSGIVTHDRDEVRHATASEQRYQAYPVGTDPLGNPAPSDGFRPDILKYGWPGTITQPVYKAFEGEYYIDPENHEAYRIDGFSHDPTGCDGEAAKIFPLVVKPAPEREQEIRPLLESAADQALTLKGHYRFGAYSNGAMAADSSYNAPRESGWAADTLAVVCSTFIWDTLRLAHVVLEGDQLEPNDFARGAERDATTQDGLYLYQAAERQKAGHTLYDRTHNHVLDEADKNTCFGLPCGRAWEFFAGAADDIANQLVNCFDTDWCDTAAKDSDRWKNTGPGRSVSPDNILFWDIWSAPDQGVYGYNERMAYQPGMYAQDRWLPSGDAGTITGHVFFEGKLAANALVRVAGLEKTTDANGAFTFVGIPAGAYKIEASKTISPDQTAHDQKDVNVAARATTTVDLNLGFAPPPQPRAIVHVVIERLNAFGCWGTYIDLPDPPWPLPDIPPVCTAPEDADFYAEVTIDGQAHSTRDNYIHNQNDVSPNWDLANQVDSSKAMIPISIHIGDVDGALRGDDDTADIKPGPGRDLSLLLDLNTCSVSGDAAGGCNAQIHSAGDDADGHEDQADIWFHVYVELLPPAAQQASQHTVMRTATGPNGSFAIYLPMIMGGSSQSTTGWEGTTSAGHRIEFRRSADGTTITSIWLYAVAGTCGVTGISSNQVIPITNNQFALATEALTLTGKFTTATAAEGTYAIHLTIPNCGVINETGTWIAKGL